MTDMPKKMERQRLLRIKRRRELVEIHGGYCAHCKVSYPDHVYDFHHIDPSKKLFSLTVKYLTNKWVDLVSEANKCILLCSNCHRIEHNKIQSKINENRKTNNIN